MFERLLFWIEGVGLRSADLVVGLMPFYNNYAKDRAIDIDHKYLWVSNGIHMDLVRPNHELNYINQEKVRIVYAGSLGIINKIELLLEAVAKLNPNQFELIIAGSGPKVDEVQAYASQYRHITFLGRIKSNEVGGILYRSDIAYLGVRDSELYKYGLSPNKLFDYMNQGIPILYCSNYPAGVDPDNEFMLQCKSSQVDDVVKILQDFKKMPLTKREAMKLASKKAGMRYNYSILSKKYLNALSCI
jgi:glycosyltransferase involved in cell wall biosynthesis